MSRFEIVSLTKTGGELTKKITLTDDGALLSDGSHCVMARGTADRLRLSSLAEFADEIRQLKPNQAFALGVLRDGLPDHVTVATKAKVQKLNGLAAPDLIARTAGNIAYRAKQAALALVDFDRKGMPDDVASRIDALGGVWPALVSVVPELAATARVTRASTSAGLHRTDTGELLPGSGGIHIYLHVVDGADSDRFLRNLHDRCWLAGLGWLMVGAAGQLLERSIVDRMIGAGERLCFEAAPILDAPLAQDQAARAPVVVGGEPLDTVTACPPLSIVEQTRLRDLRAKAGYHLWPEARKVREAYIAEHAQELGQRTSLPPAEARRVIERQCNGILLPDIVLPFDDPDLRGKTVADVLADPAAYEGATLADPLEGVAYGTGKAKIMRRADDGAPWINSFAHGRTTYELKLDGKAASAAIEAASEDTVARVFIEMALAADLDEDETETLRNRAAERGKIGRLVLNRMLKTAREQQSRKRAQEDHQRLLAQRTDPRAQIDAPGDDAPWLPQMGVLNDVLFPSPLIEPPVRDIDGDSCRGREHAVPLQHLLSSATNQGETSDG